MSGLKFPKGQPPQSCAPQRACRLMRKGWGRPTGITARKMRRIPEIVRSALLRVWPPRICTFRAPSGQPVAQHELQGFRSLNKSVSVSLRSRGTGFHPSFRPPLVHLQPPGISPRLRPSSKRSLSWTLGCPALQRNVAFRSRPGSLTGVAAE